MIGLPQCRLENANADERQQTINLFARVSGIGPVAARKFYDDGVRTLEQLAQQKLNTHQMIGVKYFKEFEERIPRPEMVKLEKIIKQAAQAVDPHITVTISGS